MAPRYDVRWLESEQVIEVEYEGVKIVDDESFDAWKTALLAGLSAIHRRIGCAAPLIVNIDELELHPRMGERYSHELALPIAHKYASVIARYGSHGSTGRIVAVEAMRRTVNLDDPAAKAREYAANTFATREEALAFVISWAAGRNDSSR